MPVILIVEDDDFIRELSEIMIQEWGFQTLSASDEDEALSYLRSPQQIDVLFTDIYLKTRPFGGCELALQAKKLRPELGVIYATGNFITGAVTAMFIADTHCLAKPYTSDELLSSLRDIVGT